MRKTTLLTFLLLTVAFSLQAETKHQSFITYDDGGTVVRQGEDAREIEGRVNLPIYPGDEVITNRRGRVEIRLSDGNVIAVDRATAIRFQSILDSYEGESSDTIAELRNGKVMVYRTDEGREAIRLDTASASYFASREAIFSVEADAGGEDRVNVFDGVIEVRTPSRTTRLRSGEVAKVDDRGLYSLASDSGTGSDDFERWFLRRAERYGRANSRYLDRSLAYYDDELGRYGSWIYISGYGYSWRPYGISATWRPYYYGTWGYGRNGCLTWISHEPWGWVPYHYGRWAHDPFYGWFWVPGSGYSPAWVYWWYSPGYIGWAPAGWWDCYRPYYDWAYRPYSRAGIHFGFGFYGRIRVNDVDLRPWTFVDANTIVSTRVDRAALTTDAVRGRLTRDNGGFATIGTTPARFTREEMRDPAAAVGVIARRAGGGTGREAASPTDLTPFIRRDADLPGTIRDRVVRTRPTPTAPSEGVAQRGSGSVAPIGRGSVAPIGGGSVAPIGGGSVAPTNRGDSGGRINRGEQPRSEQPPPRFEPRTEQPRTEQPRTEQPPNRSESPTWRDRVSRAPRTEAPVTGTPVDEAPISRTPERSDNSWRARVVRESPRSGSSGSSGGEAPRASEGESSDRSSDVPRRIIDRVGGPRLYPSGERPSSSGSKDSGDRSSARSGESAPRSRPATVDRPSSSSPPPRTERSSPPPRSSDSGSSRSSGNREGGGRIKRD